MLPNARAYLVQGQRHGGHSGRENRYYAPDIQLTTKHSGATTIAREVFFSRYHGEGGREGEGEQAGRVLEPNNRAIEMANIFGFYRASPVLSIIRIVARSHRWVFDFQTSARGRRCLVENAL